MADKKSEVRQTRRWRKTFKTKCKSTGALSLLTSESDINLSAHTPDLESEK